MNKTFRDILAQFLEGKDKLSASQSAQAEETPAFESTLHWRLKSELSEQTLAFARSPSRKGLRHYQAARAPEASPVTPQPKKTPLAPEAEPLISLERLTADAQAQARELIQLGAAELSQGLSRKRLKKAYRLLARKFHPDRLPAGALPEQIKLTAAQFMRAQTAYNELLEALEEIERAPARGASAA